MKNRDIQTSAVASLLKYIKLTSNFQKPKLLCQQNSAIFSLLKIKVLQGRPPLECLTFFHSLHTSLVKEINLRYSNLKKSNNIQKRKSDIKDSILRMAVHLSNQMFYMAKLGKLKCAFKMAYQLKSLFPLLEPKALQFMTHRLEFFTANFENTYEELIEFEEIISEFEITRIHSRSENIPPLTNRASNFAYYRDILDEKADMKVFDKHNELVVAKIRAIQKTFKEEGTISKSDGSSLVVTQKGKYAAARAKGSKKKLRGMEDTIFHINRKRATNEDPCSKQEHLRSLNVAKSHIDQYFMEQIDTKLDIQFSQAQISQSLNQFRAENAAANKVLSVCKNTLKMNSKEIVKPILADYIFTSQMAMSQETFVKEIAVKHRQLQRSNSATMIDTTQAHEKHSKVSMKSALIKKKYLKVSTLERMRDTYFKSNRDKNIPVYNHTESLKTTKEVSSPEHQVESREP